MPLSEIVSPQILAFAILAGMMLLFMWGRLRYDIVAVIALLVSIALGTVPAKKAFTGFSDDIVIIVGSALIVSGAVERSGVIELALAKVGNRLKHVRSQLIVLVASVTFLSALVKNIGALAMLMPAAVRMAKKDGNGPAVFLMPMAFGSLLGGLITLVGTSPNIIVSRVREEMTGEPFKMFDYAPVGLGLSLVGLIFLRFGYRLIPRDRRSAPTLDEALAIDNYVTEARIGDGASVGLTLSEVRGKLGSEVVIRGLLRGTKRPTLLPDLVLAEGDVLLLEGEPQGLERAIESAGLTLEGQDRTAVTETSSEDVASIEAVIGAGSLLSGRTAGGLGLHEHYGVNLLAVSRRGERIVQRPGEFRLRPGDVVVLQGPVDLLPTQLSALDLLPLAERQVRLGNARKGLLPIAILAGAMTLTAFGVVPVAVAFFGAAALMMLVGAIPARDAYERVEWPILIMLGALIPVSEALETTGGTKLIADWLSHTAAGLPPWGAVGLILVAAMAVTPFLNNAATVLVMAPIAATFASELGYRPEAFLMATAVGAGCDFLTPIGHQCNTLVMGPGGYRFGDYARLGAPLSLLVILVGVPLILATWPIH